LYQTHGNNKATTGQTEGKVWWLIFNKIFQQTNQKLANNNGKKIPTSQIPQEGKKNLLPDCPIQPTNQPTERTNRETLIKFQKSINQSCFHHFNFLLSFGGIFCQKNWTK
jgi:hypothetical protein